MVTVRRGSLAAVAPAQTRHPSRRVSPDRLMERCVARIVPLEALPIDHRPPLASQGAARLVRRTARAQVDGRDHGAHGRDHGAWTAETTAPTAKHGTFHLSRGLIGAARVSDLFRRGSQIVAPVLPPGRLVVPRRARALLAVADGVDA